MQWFSLALQEFTGRPTVPARSFVLSTHGAPALCFPPSCCRQDATRLRLLLLTICLVLQPLPGLADSDIIDEIAVTATPRPDSSAAMEHDPVI